MANENGQERRETLADIVAEIRAYGAQPPPRLMWLEIADRIEAIDSADAWRSLYTPGNAAAMREALELALDALISWLNGTIDRTTNRETIKAIRAALAAPARQCDVGSPEEQKERFDSFCNAQPRKRCVCDCILQKNCQGLCEGLCEFAWAQMPYEAQEGAGE